MFLKNKSICRSDVASSGNRQRDRQSDLSRVVATRSGSPYTNGKKSFILVSESELKILVGPLLVVTLLRRKLARHK